jgi:hypothetical protein
MIGVVDLTEKETKIEGQRQNDEESENYFFQIHKFKLPGSLLLSTTVRATTAAFLKP